MFAPVLYMAYGYGTDDRTGPRTHNLLFDGDVPQYTAIMTQRGHSHHGVYSNRHPLVSLYLFPPAKILRFFGLSPPESVHVTMAMTCGVWTILMFSLLVVWGCRLVDAAVFTVLALISASSMVWHPVPESYPIGSATIIAALILTLWPRNASPLIRYTAAAAVSLSMTLTNAIVGLIAGARGLATRDLWIAGTSAWFIVCMLWVLQKWAFPVVEFFLPPREVNAMWFSLTPNRIAQVLQVMLSHSIVMPEFGVMSGSERIPPSTAVRMMTVQKSLLGTGGLWGLIATFAWIGLVGLGVWAACSIRCALSTLCLLVGGTLMAFYLVWGTETFLFSLHMVPFLIVLTAGVTFTRWRPLSLALAIVVIVLGGANNWGQFQKAVAITHEIDAFARTFPAE